MPSLADQDPQVEMVTDFEIALRHLKQVARRLRAAGAQSDIASDVEIPIRLAEPKTS